jgi:hypothetical protein
VKSSENPRSEHLVRKTFPIGEHSQPNNWCADRPRDFTRERGLATRIEWHTTAVQSNRRLRYFTREQCRATLLLSDGLAKVKLDTHSPESPQTPPDSTRRTRHHTPESPLLATGFHIRYPSPHATRWSDTVGLESPRRPSRGSRRVGPLDPPPPRPQSSRRVGSSVEEESPTASHRRQRRPIPLQVQRRRRNRKTRRADRQSRTER